MKTLLLSSWITGKANLTVQEKNPTTKELPKILAKMHWSKIFRSRKWSLNTLGPNMDVIAIFRRRCALGGVFFQQWHTSGSWCISARNGQTKKTFFNKHSVCFLLKPVAEHAEKCNAAYSLRTFTCLTGCRDKDSGKNSPHLKIVFPLASQLTILKWTQTFLLWPWGAGL